MNMAPYIIYIMIFMFIGTLSILLNEYLLKRKQQKRKIK
jgi:hypothetical protein